MVVGGAKDEREGTGIDGVVEAGVMGGREGAELSVRSLPSVSARASGQE